MPVFRESCFVSPRSTINRFSLSRSLDFLVSFSSVLVNVWLFPSLYCIRVLLLSPNDSLLIKHLYLMCAIDQTEFNHRREKKPKKTLYPNSRLCCTHSYILWTWSASNCIDYISIQVFFYESNFSVYLCPLKIVTIAGYVNSSANLMCGQIKFFTLLLCHWAKICLVMQMNLLAFNELSIWFAAVLQLEFVLKVEL